MKSCDEALKVPCRGETLLAVLSRPERPRRTAVVVVVGGPQYRAGSHRQFVLLARRLAADGWTVLRFDARGMGDSGGGSRGFKALDDDIAAAVAAVARAVPGVERVVLWGLCDGASAALLYCGGRGDPRIAGLCLVNPWLRSEASLARTHVRHYYARRLVQPAFWSTLLRGGLGWSAISGLLGNVRAAAGAGAPPRQGKDFRDAMALAWAGFSGRILLVVSGADLTAREFDDGLRTDPRWRGALARPNVERCDIARADHTFSRSAGRQAMEAAVLRWLGAGFAEQTTAARAVMEDER